MEIVAAILEIVKSVWTPLARQVGYVKNLQKNFEILNEKARNLYMLCEDVKVEIDKDKVEKMPTNECILWVQKVVEIETQVNEIEQEYKENKNCMRGWCPNLSTQRKLGKRVVETIDRIKDINKYEGPVVVDVPRQIVEIMPPTEIEASTTINRTIKKILYYMQNERIGKIGIWGMGGVGKTTVMKALNNLPELSKIFEIIIWVTVSKDWSLRKVQEEIGNRLSLDIKDNESDVQVSRRLLQKLKTIKYLLLLDDMWDKVDLDQVGVPYPNQKRDSKIVLTTRFLQVCNKMESDENMRVETLSEEEAWKLFHKKAGQVIDSIEIQPWARDVVKECGGLPLAIIVVGASLRNEKNVSVWRNALTELRSPSTVMFEINQLEEEVFKILKFSYDRLKDDNVKNCFLFAALYPEDRQIETFELIEYWRAEGLLYNAKNLVEARDKGHAILKYLIEASLFETIEDDDSVVKLHDVIRDLALRITSPLKLQDCRFFVRAGVGLEKPPEDGEWEQAERISLMSNELVSLPEMPKCSTLTTLLLQWNYNLASIPESFFMHMTSLRVLDLSGIRIKTLPMSICKLVSLRALYAPTLETIPPQIGVLTSLETLHFERNNYLPVEMVKLKRLRSLQVSLDKFVDSDENHQQQLSILSSLPLLEELILTVDSQYVDMIESEMMEVRGLVERVCELKELRSLQFSFPTIDCLNYFLQRSQPWIKGRLTSFHFYVGKVDRFYGIKKYSNEYQTLTFTRGDSIPAEIVEVLNHANQFKLFRHSTIEKLSDLGVESIKGLTHCTIDDCSVMEAILEDGIDALPSLKSLWVWNCPMLKSLWKGSVLPTSFVTLFVNNCPNLKRLPLGIHNATTLRQIKGEREWWDALEWEDDAIKQHLQPLFVPR